ncbi:hypothetical protein BZG36_00315 [Bifiguratus adelaidae]|uniref:N-alpha-acetyltransferase 40 n=1 Tax=Bifiguratus adelaidae TaxID=1938954 RepID=A0A261Y7P6_9FUNG|nr:hypothetical protein BZG36_00315 [Bifiguratus adelaidae]
MPFQKDRSTLGEDKVAKANKAHNIAECIQGQLEVKATDEHYVIEYMPIDTLSATDRVWVMDMVKQNMMELYVNSNDGWSEEEKRSELYAPEARYLIVKDAKGTKVGFLMFQFVWEETMEDDAEVQAIYCYEIQLISEVSGKGIGSHLMKLLEDIGRAWDMEKAMLTVFRANQGAFHFYREKLGYELDEISPSACLPPRRAQRFDYEILSKRLDA